MEIGNNNEKLPNQLTDIINFEAATESLYIVARSFEVLFDDEYNNALLEKFGDMNTKKYFEFKESLKYCREILKKVEQSTKYFELPENHII